MNSKALENIREAIAELSDTSLCEELGHRLEEVLHAEDYLNKGWHILEKFKDEGGSQKEAYLQVLMLIEKYMVADNEELEERIAEIGDYVCGFCSPRSYIWPDYLK